MPEVLDTHALDVLTRLDLTAEMVHAHRLRPDHLAHAAEIGLHEPGAGDDRPEAPRDNPFYTLDIEGLGNDLHALLSRCTAGYAMQLRRRGRVLIDRRWRWARTPADGAVAWGPDVQMHIASVSKLITAIALTKVLADRNISPDARIARWLPPYWVLGPGVDRITFRQLLTHTSGLVGLTAPGPMDYVFIKDQVALGVVAPPAYKNANYGLCRILLATIDAPHLFAPLTTTSDQYWDLTTTRYYRGYVQAHVFDPVGVAASLVHEADDALAYPVPVAGTGWDSGDKSALAGACGWHLSVDDLLAVMANIRRIGDILEPWRAQAMLDRGFGFDVVRDTLLGRIYLKSGFWAFDGTGQLVEQTYVVFLPHGMELAILANSTFCNPNTNFQAQLLAVIEESIRLRALAIAAVAGVAIAAGALLARSLSRRGR
jgi:CubicO group peptidase (beta-lactamase class C family)